MDKNIKHQCFEIGLPFTFGSVIDYKMTNMKMVPLHISAVKKRKLLSYNKYKEMHPKDEIVLIILEVGFSSKNFRTKIHYISMSKWPPIL